jgi:hypothetical protein
MRFFGVVIVLVVLILPCLCVYEQRLYEATLQVTAYSTACFDREKLCKVTLKAYAS